MTEKLENSLGADGKIWCLPCAYTNRPPKGGARFGWRTHPFGGYKFHKGVDLDGEHGMPLYATKDGKITLATYSSSAGNYIILDHLDGTKSVYMHMGQAYGEYPNKDQVAERTNYNWRVHVGDMVKQGDHIGDMGSTGCSTGTHLHFGVQLRGHNDPNSDNYVDPMLYIGNTTETRVQLSEIDLDNSWKPFNFKIGSNEGSSKMNMIRRSNLIGNLSTPLFSSQLSSNNLYTRYALLGLNTKEVVLPEIKDITTSEFWKIAKDDCGFKQSSQVIKNNYSYVISRVNELFKITYANNIPKFKVDRAIDDWFEYNIYKLKYTYGNLPVAGSIMCWKPLKENLPYKIKFVESVKGTHWIEVSEYDVSKANPLLKYVIKNEDHNWGQGHDYAFQGFIYVLPDIVKYSEVPEETSVFIDNSNDLIINVMNNSNTDKYSTIVFNIDNMKHVNRCYVKYEAYSKNSKQDYIGNTLSFCLTQQIWNCTDVGDLNYTVHNEESREFKANWPTTYFPYKVKYENGVMVVPNNPDEHPYRYNGPYPSGALCLDKVPINNTKSNNIEITKVFDFDCYLENGRKLNSFDSEGDISRLIRNYPGYLCLTIKAPKVNESGQTTSTTVKIKQIILYG